MNIVLFICSTLIVSCGGSKIGLINSEKNSMVSLSSKDNHFVGFLVVDPISRDTLINQNADTYFTPASNVKIFTLFTVLKLLPSKLPAIKYIGRNDTLYIEGTGDPTFLHPDFQSNTTLNFLKNHNNIAIHLNNYVGERYRPGWAWEDFDTYFSPEIGALPSFGNVVTVTQTDSLFIFPDYFKKQVLIGKKKKRRAEFSNNFYVPYTTDTLRIPFITSKTTTKALLERELGSTIRLIDKMPLGNKTILSGISSDSLYKKMMYESDNFMAEQMMLMASSQLSDTLSFTMAKQQILQNHLSDLAQEPRWVDGSGLSRYNLFTPKSMVHVLSKLYAEFPKKRLFNLFPRWNEKGTLKGFQGEDSFIIAKSGALGNNYNLSGYLITKSGKVLLFSYMNNHFRKPSLDLRQHMYDVLKSIHESN